MTRHQAGRQAKQAAVIHGQLILPMSCLPGVLYSCIFKWFTSSVLESTLHFGSLYNTYVHVAFALVDDNP